MCRATDEKREKDVLSSSYVHVCWNRYDAINFDLLFRIITFIYSIHIAETSNADVVVYAINLMNEKYCIHLKTIPKLLHSKCEFFVRVHVLIESIKNILFSPFDKIQLNYELLHQSLKINVTSVLLRYIN